ncbi:hypothetical protein BHE74_00025689 [Ensete ventricosum]|nr:hypothetical protein GW17_00012291 [Ensete ventricosum]RWW66922.1 hypothetical protein BHE74_00025689 [Ensete ventricosum]RZS02885.1 hypothetical protein BHM03_00032991 [Ensete ventricosum]
MGLYSNSNGVSVPESLIFFIAYHTAAPHHVVRGPCGETRSVDSRPGNPHKPTKLTPPPPLRCSCCFVLLARQLQIWVGLGSIDWVVNDLRAPVGGLWLSFSSATAATASTTATKWHADLRRDLQALLASHRRGRPRPW